MLINDIIIEASPDVKEIQRFDRAMQNWLGTSGQYFDSAAKSYVASRGKAIFGKGGVSPTDAISMALEEYKNKKQNTKQKQKKSPNAKMTYGDDNKKTVDVQPQKGQAGWQDRTHGHLRTRGKVSDKLKQAIGPATPDLKSMDTAVGSGMDIGANIADKFDKLMKMGDLYRRSRR